MCRAKYDYIIANLDFFCSDVFAIICVCTCNNVTLYIAVLNLTHSQSKLDKYRVKNVDRYNFCFYESSLHFISIDSQRGVYAENYLSYYEFVLC
jgi:hypothetical protein